MHMNFLCGCFGYKIMKSFIRFAVHLNMKKVTVCFYLSTLFTSIAFRFLSYNYQRCFTCIIMPKIAKISGGSPMKKRISFPSDRNFPRDNN